MKTNVAIAYCFLVVGWVLATIYQAKDVPILVNLALLAVAIVGAPAMFYRSRAKADRMAEILDMHIPAFDQHACIKDPETAAYEILLDMENEGWVKTV
jgi:hypothetical protein